MAFFRGFSATLLRDAPYAGIYLLFYERIKAGSILSLSNSRNQPDNHIKETELFLLNGISAFSAAVMASLVTHPFDVIKTRMQIYPQIYPKFIGTLRTMIQQEGSRAFLAGIGPRLARKGLNAAITWAIYEQLSKSSSTAPIN